MALLPEKTEKNLDNNLCITSHSIPSLTVSSTVALTSRTDHTDSCSSHTRDPGFLTSDPFPRSSRHPRGGNHRGIEGSGHDGGAGVHLLYTPHHCNQTMTLQLLYQLFQSTHCAENVNFGVQTLDRLVSVWTDFGEELELHHSSPSKKLLYIASRESQQQPQTLTLIMISHSQFSKPLHSHICTN